MRLPTIVTLLAAASAILSAAAADISADADALSQSTNLRGAGSDAGIHQSLLEAIEADEIEEFDALGLTLQQETQPDQYDRELGRCGDDAKVFKVDLTTTGNGSGTSWRFFRYDRSQAKWFRVGLGPDGAVAYDDNTRYLQYICVDPATYAFVMRDTKGQKPNYTCYFRGSKVFGLESDFSGRKVHYFTYKDPNSSSGGTSSTASSPPPTPQPSPAPTPQPSPKPTPPPINPDISGRLADCNWDERLFTISLKADEYGDEISWNLKKQGSIVLQSDRTYKNYETDTVEACISADAYEFTIMDTYGDGIRDPGYYKIYLDGVLTFEGGKGYRTRTIPFSFGQQDMTERDQQWLDSHNIRREKWHKDYGKSYVPLKWSVGLKESSQVWATELLKTCGQSLYHDPNNKKYGENLASNSGTGSFANVQSTEKVVGRFVEWEDELPWPLNAHFTQVIWRGSDHVGCAESAKDLGGGKKCHVQVCRYSRAGNCAMQSFNDGSDKWWMNAVMQDESRCGAECPPDGCIID